MKSSQSSSRQQRRWFCCFLLIGLAGLFDPSRLLADQWQPDKTHVLIVGVLEWKADLTPFSKQRRKDKELRDRLIERGTPPENITMLLDSEATLSNIRQALEQTLQKADEGSTLIVYYAGHGWQAGEDYCFANYDVRLGPHGRESAWSMNELAQRMDEGFRGERAFFWADCCYSGGMRVVVDKLASRNLASFSLTSAATTNASTGNWTFTQSLIDGLAGEPLIDTNQDGQITLAEWQVEVQNAMHHLEGQEHGFHSAGVDDQLVIAPARGKVTAAPNAKYPLGSYVRAKRRYGRVVGRAGEQNQRYQVQFYNYTDKVVREFAESDLAPSTRARSPEVARLEPDCQVEWQGGWYEAKILRQENGRWLVRYIGYDESWDEWVGKDRIRLDK